MRKDNGTCYILSYVDGVLDIESNSFLEVVSDGSWED